MSTTTNIQQLIEQEEQQLNEKKTLLKSADKSIKRLRVNVDDIAATCEKLVRSHDMNQTALLAGLGLNTAESRVVSAGIRKLTKNDIEPIESEQNADTAQNTESEQQ